MDMMDTFLLWLFSKVRSYLIPRIGWVADHLDRDVSSFTIVGLCI